MSFFKVTKSFAVLGFMCALTACETTKTNSYNPEDNEQDRKVHTAKINTQLGMAYLERKNIGRAKQKLLMALEQAPNIPEPWYTMAYFFESTGEMERADAYYRKAIAIAPDRGDTHNNYGTFLCRRGQYQTSIQQFMTAVNDAKYLDSADAYENAGLCSLKIPNQKQAAYYFQQALNQDPSRQVSLYNLAELNYKAGDFSAAKKNVNELLTVATPTKEALALADKIELKFGQSVKLDFSEPKTVAMNIDQPKFADGDHSEEQALRILAKHENILKKRDATAANPSERLITASQSKPVAPVLSSKAIPLKQVASVTPVRVAVLKNVIPPKKVIVLHTAYKAPKQIQVLKSKLIHDLATLKQPVKSKVHIEPAKKSLASMAIKTKLISHKPVAEKKKSINMASTTSLKAKPVTQPMKKIAAANVKKNVRKV